MSKSPEEATPRSHSPSSSHLAWMIEGRAKNQRTALQLYRLFDRQPFKNDEHNSEIQTLTGVAFSLWRAVFLADRSDIAGVKLSDAKKFLGKMLTDNAIGFAQDRDSRNWTFNYYMSSAIFFLEVLGEKGLRPSRGAWSDRWEKLHEAFERQVERLRSEIEN